MIERLIVGPFHTNTYIVTTAKKECIVIDPGAEPDQILKRLEVLNVSPVLVLLTHGHIDHVSAVGALQSRYGSDEHPLPIYMHENDFYLLTEAGRADAQSIFEPFGEEGIQSFGALFESRPQIGQSVTEGDLIPGTDLTVMHTPGHTAGSVTYYSEGLAMAWTGDTVFFKAIGRTDFAGSNPERIDTSVHDRIFTLPPETRLFPGHGPDTTVERETANSPLTTDHTMI